jgi:hypothetical protein
MLPENGLGNHGVAPIISFVSMLYARMRSRHNAPARVAQSHASFSGTSGFSPSPDHARHAKVNRPIEISAVSTVKPVGPDLNKKPQVPLKDAWLCATTSFDGLGFSKNGCSLA